MNESNPTSFIYIIGSKGGTVKVGHSATPDILALQLSAHQSECLVVLGKYPVGQERALAVERYAHWLLRDKQISNEWFAATVKDAALAIEAAIVEPVHPRYPIPSLDVQASEMRGGDRIATKFPAGTRDRIHRMSNGHHAQFIRDAVEEKLAREEKAKS